MKWGGGYPHDGLVGRIQLKLLEGLEHRKSPVNVATLLFVCFPCAIPVLELGELQERSQRNVRPDVCLQEVSSQSHLGKQDMFLKLGRHEKTQGLWECSGLRECSLCVN